MRQTKCTLHIIKNQRLCILSCGCSCRRITHMTYSNITLQLLQIFRCKHLIDQAHSFWRKDFPLWSLCVRNCNTTTFLTTMLQRKQPIINGCCYIISIKIVNTEYTTFLMQCIFFKTVVKYFAHVSLLTFIKNNRKHQIHTLYTLAFHIFNCTEYMLSFFAKTVNGNRYFICYFYGTML